MTVAVTREDTAWIADDSTFGARLALIRQRMAWGNVAEAAQACGIPVESWRTWERDGVQPQMRRYFEACKKIALVAGCDYGWLVDRRRSGSSQPTLGYIALELASSRTSLSPSSNNRPILALVDR